jgi:hypothetical protein
VFIYSRFIKSGALPLALALEANGYTPHGQDKTLFINGPLDGQGRQCALCNLRERGHPSNKHKFTPAKYVLLTGQANLSPNNALAIKAARTDANMYGKCKFGDFGYFRSDPKGDKGSLQDRSVLGMVVGKVFNGGSSVRVFQPNRGTVVIRNKFQLATNLDKTMKNFLLQTYQKVSEDDR